MSRDNQLDDWARRLEKGDRSEPELELAARLRQTSLPRPAAPPDFKHDLRGRLLQRYQSPGWSFGRLVSSLAAIAVLVAAVALFRLWLIGASQIPFASPAVGSQSTPTPPPSPTDSHATTISTPTPIGQPPEADDLLMPAMVPIRLLSHTFYSERVEPGGTVELPLNWEPAALAIQPLNLFIHLTTAEGEIVAQLDTPITGPSSDPYSLFIRPTTAPGDYLLLAGLYRPDTGERLLLQSADTTATALQVGTVKVVTNRVWIVSVSPEPGTAVDQSTVFDVEIGYELVSAPEAMIKVHLAHPNWQGMPPGQLPIEGMSEWLPITAGEGTLNVRYEVEDSNYLTTLLGDRATLYTQLATEEEGGRLNILLDQTFTDYTWPLANP
jgi:hypothetical protein